MRRRWARLATAVGCWAMSQKRTCPVIMHSTQNRPSYAMQQSLVGRRRQLGATAATAAIQNLVTDDATMQRFKRPAACCRRCGRAASIIRNLSSTPLAHAHALIMAENLTQHRAGKALLALLQAQKGLADDVVQQITQLTAELLEEATGSGPAAGKAGKAQAPQPAAGAVALRHLQAADALLPGLCFISPKGKFDCGVYSDCLQAANKQTSVEVPWASIQHVLIIDAIPKQPSTTYVVLVMKSGQPVRQGKNLLDLVVIQTKDQPELSIPAPEACQHLGRALVGAAAVVLSQLLASYLPDVDDATFLTADSSVFSSSTGDLMVAANKGVNAGWLVPLSAGLCYLGKGGCFMPRAGISKLLFHRTGGGSATFDVTIKLGAAAAGAGAGAAGAGAAAAAGAGAGAAADARGGAHSLELGQIDAAELPKLQAYCANQRIKIGSSDDDDDDDDDDEAVAGAGSGSHTAAVGAAAAAAAAQGFDDDNDDDDEEEDEDFDPERHHGAKRRRTGGSSGGAAAAAGDQDEGDDAEEEEADDEEGSGYEDGSSSEGSEDLVPSDELDAMDEEEADWAD